LQAPRLRTLDCRDLVPRSVLECDLDAAGMGRVTATLKKFGEELGAFIERGTQLEKMHLASSSMPDASFLRILERIRGLRHLHLEDSFVSNSLIFNLIQEKPGKTSSLCPVLQTIILDSCPLVSGKMLIDFIQSRKLRPFPITSLSVGRCNLINAQHVQTLRNVDPEKLQVALIPDVEC